MSDLLRKFQKKSFYWWCLQARIPSKKCEKNPVSRWWPGTSTKYFRLFLVPCPTYLKTFTRRQDISSHDIDYVEQVGSCLNWERVSNTCVVSMWRNDTKCKYMFMFPLKILARKGINKFISSMYFMLNMSCPYGCLPIYGFKKHPISRAVPHDNHISEIIISVCT